ncbi:hypothetical protein KM043_007513 [Ampulex compressa]|nr:hypothetical protein KM043_007513 [Ampulex compressa]
MRSSFAYLTPIARPQIHLCFTTPYRSISCIGAGTLLYTRKRGEFARRVSLALKESREDISMARGPGFGTSFLAEGPPGVTSDVGACAHFPDTPYTRQGPGTLGLGRVSPLVYSSRTAVGDGRHVEREQTVLSLRWLLYTVVMKLRQVSNPLHASPCPGDF